jgi:uncharacterized protein (TIGR03435 family)
MPFSALNAFRKLLLPATLFLVASSHAQETFDVATIRPASERVKFEHNGSTASSYGTLTMRDVNLVACIHYAYRIPFPLISVKNGDSAHYDITAKAAPNTTDDQTRLMMQALLKERFHLTFHHEKQERRVYLLTGGKVGAKLHPAAPGGTPFRENGMASMTVKSMTIAEIADYVSDPVDAPLIDNTGLTGRYDFVVDFRPYVDMERNDGVRPDPAAVVRAAFKGELGIEMTAAKQTVDVFIVDRADPPTAN